MALRLKTLMLGMCLLVASYLLASNDFTHAQDAPEKPMSRTALIEAIKGGGHILYIRHERTEVPSRADDYTRPANECRAQRNLSVSGVAAANETGLVLRAAEIPIGRVITSPMCRAAETARYMFGVNYELDARLMHHDPSRESKRNLSAAVTEANTVIGEIATNLMDTNIALIGHGGTIRGVTGMTLEEGVIAVLRVDEDGTISTLGHLTGSALGFYVRWQSPTAQE